MKDTSMTKLKKLMESKYFFILISLLLLILVSCLLSSSFLTIRNMMTIFRQASILLMLSLGLTAVVLTGNIDLSVGGCAALTGCFCARMLVGGTPVGLTILLCLLIGILIGTFNGIMVGIIGLPSFVATYGMNMVAAGLATIVMNGGVIYDLPRNFTTIGIGFLGPIPVPVIITGLTALLLSFLLRKTIFGRSVYLIGYNRRAADYSGISSLRVLLLSYILCGITGSLGGILITARLNAADAGMSEAYGLQIVAAVVVGGTSLLGGEGGVAGTLIGAIILTMIVNIMNIMGVDSNWQNFVLGIVILFMVWIDVFTRRRLSASRQSKE